MLVLIQTAYRRHKKCLDCRFTFLDKENWTIWSGKLLELFIEKK